MAGLDLPVKLRRGLGKGSIVPAEELAQRLRTFDGDRDGAVTEDELARFFYHNQVGGPWFCKMFAHTVWNMAEEHYAREIYSIKVEALSKVIHFTMSRSERPTRRYVLTPEAAQGLAPKTDLAGNDTTVSTKAVPSEGKKVEPRPAPRAADPGPRPQTNPGPGPGPGPGPRPSPRPVPRRPGPGPGPGVGPKPRK